MSESRQADYDTVILGGGVAALWTANVLKAAGLEIAGMVSIFTYGFPQADKAFEEAGVKFIPLTNYNNLITLAVAKGMVSAENEASLEAWRQSPDTWGR